jgi:hypothetical protein
MITTVIVVVMVVTVVIVVVMIVTVVTVIIIKNVKLGYVEIRNNFLSKNNLLYINTNDN